MGPEFKIEAREWLSGGPAEKKSATKQASKFVMARPARAPLCDEEQNADGKSGVRPESEEARAKHAGAITE
jgi:hypothetical protein